MHNLIFFIDTYFRENSPEKVINDFSNNLRNKDDFYFKSPKSDILHDNSTFFHYCDEEIENIFTRSQKSLKIDHNNKENIFNHLINYSQDVLREIENEPVCRYKHLLNWSEICRHLGEEMLTTSFFAYNDYKLNKDRNYFAWKPIINSDNTRISEMLFKGIAENHFHMKASAQHAFISWISLMNNITGRSKEFKEFIPGKDSESNTSYLLVKKAAYIRVLLFEKILKFNDHNYNPQQILGDNFINVFLSEIQSNIDSLKCLHGLPFNINGENIIPDYCIPCNILESNFNGNILLCGERYFLYNIFRMILFDKLTEEEQELFYIYLLIKSKFRSEFIQLNNKVGLSNFVTYQDKKEIFIEKSFYEIFLHNMAINSSIKNQNIVSLEARITPKNSAGKISSSIKLLDKNVNLETFNEPEYNRFDAFMKREICNPDIKVPVHFYNLHFIKKNEKFNKKYPFIYRIIPRNYELRNQIRKESYAISSLRESLRETSQRIFGIDSAGGEIGCRPENFAQAFRFLKNHNLKNKFERIKPFKVPKLGATFHAGEDFLDIVDGLRYIDEAINFCNLEQGDRLGHALALGIDAKQYYSFKKHTLYLPKQDLLDNIVWLLARIRKYSIDSNSLIYELEKKYNRLFSEIYNQNVVTHHSNYYNAWKLRGDNPLLYLSGKFDKNFVCLTEWDHYSKNFLYPRNKELREIDEIAYLYHCYHFDPCAREKGAEIEEFEVKENYIQTVIEIQKKMQHEIARGGIGIETNPSSNYVIGTFKRYAKHPIINFLNLGLEPDPEKIKNCPQLFVSINTDDQGIFNTYLENEYALMALALEKEKDENGNHIYNQAMIYDWLDRIRQMGIEQSFRKQKKENK